MDDNIKKYLADILVSINAIDTYLQSKEILKSEVRYLLGETP